MIITRQKNFDSILKKINNKSVFILGCSECATICKTGGEKEVVNIKKKLEKNNINVSGYCILEPACHKLNSKRILKKYNKELNLADILLIYSCGNGCQTVSEIYDDKDIICGTDTLFLGQIKRINEFEKKCNLCGDCIVDSFENLCPISLCPKNMLNGPCGGVNNGKCEIDPNMNCIWHLIINKFNKKNKINELNKIIKPFNWSKSNDWRIKQ